MSIHHSASAGTNGQPLVEMANEPAMAAEDRFVRRWGQMSRAWGVGRTVAEVYALLYVRGQPQCADDVVRRLNISRGGASASLRTLCDSGAVRRLDRPGDQRDYYAVTRGIRELVGTVAIGRQRRGLWPVLDAVREGRRILDDTATGLSKADDVAFARCRARLGHVEECLVALDHLLGEVASRLQVAVEEPGERSAGQRTS